MKISVRLSVFLSNLFEANWLRNAESAAHFVAVSWPFLALGPRPTELGSGQKAKRKCCHKGLNKFLRGVC